MEFSSLENKSVVITGAGTERGLGRELALGFGKAGANLTLNFFTDSASSVISFLEELRSLGVQAQSVEGDISTEYIANEVVKRAKETYDRVDVIVNNAAISTPTLAHEMSLDVWQRMLDVNLTGVFLPTRAALNVMRQQQDGRIINIASQIGQRGGVEHAHYAAAKAGVIAFTKSIAMEVGRQGITANCIAPGPLETRLMDQVSDEWKTNKADDLVIPRFGLTEEVVPSALLLASSPGGNLYTGQTLGPNCGDVML